MSKFEMLRSLPPSETQREAVRTVAELQRRIEELQPQKQLEEALKQLRSQLESWHSQSLEQLKSLHEQHLSDLGSELGPLVQELGKLSAETGSTRQDLEGLPDAVASEVAQGLEPLQRLSEDVRRALEAFDQVTEAQRRTWDEMAREMGQKASQSLQNASTGLRDTLASLQASSKAAEQTAQEGRRLIEQQAHTSEGLRQAALMLHGRLPSWWRRALAAMAIALLCGLVSASAVLLGMNALSGQALNGAGLLSEEQRDLMRRGRAFNAAYEVGNPKVKELLASKYKEQGQ